MFKRQWTSLLFFLILMVAATALAACPAADPPPMPAADEERLPMLTNLEATAATVYYATLDKEYLLPLNIDINATKEVARVAMEKLLAGPPVAGVAAVLPPDTKLLDLYSSHNTVYVDVTHDIYEVEASQARLAVEAILNTILPLAEGYSLQLLIEGAAGGHLGAVDISAPLSLAYINPDAASRLLLQDFSARGREFADLALTYYIGDSAARYLVPQTLLYLPGEQADPSEGQPRQGTFGGQADLSVACARAVLKAMLEVDEQTSGLCSPFWPGTEILDIWVKDNIVYVDFSAKLIGYGGGAAAESMMADCLVYTLTSLPGISAVQVLVEGRAANLPEGLDISRPLIPSAPVNAL